MTSGRETAALGVGAFIASLGLASARAHADSPPLELEGGEVIVITDSRRERPLAETTVATEVITREEIEVSGAENLAELLEHHPGLEIFRSFRGSAIRMQGLDPEYVLVLVDGNRAIGRVGGSVDLERFPVEDIERIEIVKGASSALYGSDALAGVVNIITRTTERPLEAEIHSSYGQFDTLDLSGRIGLRRGAWSSRTTAGWHRSDGYDLSPQTIATTASSHDELHVAHRTSYQAGPRLELAGQAEYLDRDQHGIDESATGAVFDRSTRTETASTSIRARWRLMKSGALSVSGHYSMWRDQYLSDQRDANALDTYELTREQLGELSAQYDTTLTSRHFLTVGAQGLVEHLRADRLAEDGNRQRIALFGQHEWTVANTPYLVVAPGMRVDLDSQFGQHVSPKLATRWDAHQDVALRANYGVGFRAPGFRELLLRFENPSVGYRVDGNPDLEPESSRSANLGAEARLHRRAWAAVSLYHNDIDNLITTDLADDGGAGGTQVYTYVNIASARTRGVELLARIAVLAGLVVEVGYTLTDTLDRQSGSVLPGRARHRGTLEATYRLPPARLALHARGSLYGARTFFAGDEAMKAEPYAAIDARAEIGVLRRLTLFAGIENALDEGDPQLLPIPPRSFYGGATARY